MYREIVPIPSMPIRKFVQMIDEDLIKFDNIYQRPVKWRINQCSELIVTIIERDYVPPIMANKVGEIYDILDGKQRGLKAIYGFLKDKYELTNIPKVAYGKKNQTIDLNGKKFSDLPKEIQTDIEDFNLLFYYKENMTDEEQRKFINRQNSGSSFTPTEKRRLTAVSFDDFLQMAKHKLLKSFKTRKGRETTKEEGLIHKIWVLSYYKNPSFKSDYLSPIVTNEKITSEEKSEIIAGLDKYYNVYNNFCLNKNGENKIIARKLKTQTSIVYITSQAIQANKDNISDEQFIEWVAEFFKTDGISYSQEYYDLTHQATASASSVRRTKEIINNHYEQFFGIEHVEQDLINTSSENNNVFERNEQQNTESQVDIGNKSDEQMILS